MPTREGKKSGTDVFKPPHPVDVKFADGYLNTEYPTLSYSKAGGVTPAPLRVEKDCWRRPAFSAVLRVFEVVFIVLSSLHLKNTLKTTEDALDASMLPR